MSAGDDDLDDDLQLKQLRSVWVSMRDEEPSDRGMAALMAAARTKAAELEQAAQPSWWQRIAASLRRPPVLALATVTVLLGGALIVTQRKDSMKSTAVVETNDEGYGYDGAAMKGPAGAGSAAAVESTVIATPPEAPPADPAVAAPANADKVVRSEKDRADAKPSKGRPTANATPTTTKPSPAPGRERDDEYVGGAPPPGMTAGGAKAPSTGTPRGAGSAPLAIAQDSDPAPAEESGGAAPSSKAETVDSRPSPKKPIGRTPAPSIEGEDRQVTTTLDQLVKQCETAAAKGDCPAVRALAQRIYSSSPTAYKTRIANKPAIVRCLPPPADNASSSE